MRISGCSTGAVPVFAAEEKLVIYTAYEENELKDFWEQFKKDLDDFIKHTLAAESQQRAERAIRAGRFAPEIVPVDVQQPGAGDLFACDLRGREAQGVVAPGDHDALCAELTAVLEALRTSDGRPVVDRVLRTAAPGQPPHSKLPVSSAQSGRICRGRSRRYLPV